MLQLLLVLIPVSCQNKTLHVGWLKQFCSQSWKGHNWGAGSWVPVGHLLLNGRLLAVSSHGEGEELWLLFLLQGTNPILGPRQPYRSPKALLPNAITLGIRDSTWDSRGEAPSFPNATQTPRWEFSFSHDSTPLRVVPVDSTTGDMDFSA